MINLIKGDITRAKTQVIVNAANRHLIAGGGVDGAIHKAAGLLLQFCLNQIKDDVNDDNWTRRTYKENLAGQRLPTGKAVLTPSFNLAEYEIKYIIHCVGPIYTMSQNPAEELKSCYMEALRICGEQQFRSISFPSISTGIYAYPIKDAAEIAITTIQENCPSHLSVQFVLFDDETFNIYRDVLNGKVK